MYIRGFEGSILSKFESKTRLCWVVVYVANQRSPESRAAVLAVPYRRAVRGLVRASSQGTQSRAGACLQKAAHSRVLRAASHLGCNPGWRASALFSQFTSRQVR